MFFMLAFLFQILCFLKKKKSSLLPPYTGGRKELTIPFPYRKGEKCSNATLFRVRRGASRYSKHLRRRHHRTRQRAAVNAVWQGGIGYTPVPPTDIT